MRFVAPRYVDVGMPVIVTPPARLGFEPGTGLRCTVAVAAGMHARVVNERRDFSAWFYIGDLLVEAAE